MFNGNINNKHYTDVNEYNRDLIELTKKGENFTASCSISSEPDNVYKNCQKEKPCINNKTDNNSVDKFISDNLTDLDYWHKKYISAKDKNKFIENLRNQIPYELHKSQIDRLKKFNASDIEKLNAALYRKELMQDQEEESLCEKLDAIDKQYEALDDERDKIVKRLSDLNKKADELLKQRDELDDIDVINDFIRSTYYSIENAIANLNCNEMLKDNDLQNKDNEEDELSEADLLSSFKELYNRMFDKIDY